MLTYLLIIVFVLIVVVLLTDNLDAVVPVVSIFVVRNILRRGQHIFVLIDRSSSLFIRFIIMCVRPVASIVRVVNVDVGVWNVNVFTLVGRDVSVNKNGFLV